VNAVGCNVLVVGGVTCACVCCLRCAMAVVWLRRCCDDDGVAALSVTMCVVWAMWCVRGDDNDDDAAMADDSP
jgi:hypothetical protein